MIVTMTVILLLFNKFSILGTIESKRSQRIISCLHFPLTSLSHCHTFFFISSFLLLFYFFSFFISFFFFSLGITMTADETPTTFRFRLEEMWMDAQGTTVSYIQNNFFSCFLLFLFTILLVHFFIQHTLLIILFVNCNVFFLSFLFFISFTVLIYSSLFVCRDISLHSQFCKTILYYSYQ
jgi:hypothetical protein